MKRAPLSILIIAVVAVLLGAAACYARVFLRLGPTGKNTPLNHLGGTEAYRAEVQINGEEGRLLVASWSEDFSEVIRILRNSWFKDDAEALVPGSGIAVGLMRGDESVSRVIVISMDRVSLVFRLDQTPEDFVRSQHPSKQHQLRAVSPHPDSTPVFSVQNRDTSTSLELSKVNGDPHAIAAFFDQSMSAGGWVTVFPDPRPGPTGTSMAIYARTSETCCILVRQCEEPGKTLIALLHKRLARDGKVPHAGPNDT